MVHTSELDCPQRQIKLSSRVHHGCEGSGRSFAGTLRQLSKLKVLLQGRQPESLAPPAKVLASQEHFLHTGVCVTLSVILAQCTILQVLKKFMPSMNGKEKLYQHDRHSVSITDPIGSLSALAGDATDKSGKDQSCKQKMGISFNQKRGRKGDYSSRYKIV